MESKDSAYGGGWSTVNAKKHPPPLLKSPPPPPPPPPPPSDRDGDNTTHIRFLLSNAEAGLIIGKGGSTIHDFQSQSGARIILSRHNEYFPGTSNRIITVSGTVDNVLTATDFILSKILDETYVDDVDDTEPRSIYKLVVPKMCCGRLIGKGGNTIKSLVAESGASIKICPPADMHPELRDRLLVLIGTIGEQMHALELILLNLSEDPNYVQSIYARHLNPATGYNNMSDQPNGVGSKYENSALQNKEQNTCSVTFGVADEHMGIVVGRGGRVLAEIGQLTGARVKISDRGDFMPGTSDRKVTISGSPRAVHDAEAMITRKVAFASEQDGVVSRS